MTHTNTTAEAVNTIEWLATSNTTLVVPVYQRRSRWQIESCEQLLTDIRTISAGHGLQSALLRFNPASTGSPKGCCWWTGSNGSPQ